ncbi:MAG: glycoside hydrolase family 99-like domain-containing protein [Vicinamibacterales bacterium]
MAHRAVAFYLPQYHPITENDEWWGKGFTEWRNVVRSRPLFRGHYQPHLPADLGFYDLRLAESRLAQAELARAFGIDAFCYYHYWFNGRRLLERPFKEVLSSGQPDFPFCLCWANENWTRRWDGADSEVLLSQDYREEDDRRHLQALLPAFKDPRYLRIKGCPVFLVYRASHLPDPRSTVARWRDEAVQGGLPGLYLCAVESQPAEHGIAPTAGFDAAVEFAPDWTVLPPCERDSLIWRGAAKLRLTNRSFVRHRIRRYEDLVSNMLAKNQTSYLRFPCVTPGWDNTARRNTGATVFRGSTPQTYERWLRESKRRFIPPSPDENLLFVNAWNEWAEGNHLEPDQHWGPQYLEATLRALQG